MILEKTILEKMTIEELKKELGHNLKCIEIWSQNIANLQASISIAEIAIVQINDAIRWRAVREKYDSK